MNDLQIVTFDGVDVVDSRDIAVMVERDHGELLKSIRVYTRYLAEGEVPLGDFFLESTYFDGNGQERPNYLITKKGCDLIANKMIGKICSASCNSSIRFSRTLKFVSSCSSGVPSSIFFLKKSKRLPIIPPPSTRYHNVPNMSTTCTNFSEKTLDIFATCAYNVLMERRWRCGSKGEGKYGEGQYIPLRKASCRATRRSRAQRDKRKRVDTHDRP